MERYIFAVSCFAVFWNFGTSIFNVFVAHKDHHKIGYSLLKFGNIFFWIASFYLIFTVEPRSENSWIIGTAVQLFCLGFYLYLKSLTKKKLTIAFSLDQPEKLFRMGPYKYIRHPYYTCYLISYFCVGTMFPHMLAYICFTFMLLIYIWAAKLEESKFKNSPLHGEYEIFKQEAGMFWPKFWRG